MRVESSAKSIQGTIILCETSNSKILDKILHSCYSNVALIDFMKVQRDLKKMEKSNEVEEMIEGGESSDEHMTA